MGDRICHGKGTRKIEFVKRLNRLVLNLWSEGSITSLTVQLRCLNHWNSDFMDSKNQWRSRQCCAQFAFIWDIYMYIPVRNNCGMTFWCLEDENNNSWNETKTESEIYRPDISFHFTNVIWSIIRWNIFLFVLTHHLIWVNIFPRIQPQLKMTTEAIGIDHCRHLWTPMIRSDVSSPNYSHHSKGTNKFGMKPSPVKGNLINVFLFCINRRLNKNKTLSISVIYMSSITMKQKQFQIIHKNPHKKKSHKGSLSLAGIHLHITYRISFDLIQKASRTIMICLCFWLCNGIFQ